MKPGVASAQSRAVARNGSCSPSFPHSHSRRPHRGQPSASSPRPSAGFTLLEVLIALAVVALALLALTRAASVQVQSFDALRERTLAGWVAANTLTETRLANAFPPTGRSEGRTRLAERDWRWTREVQSTPDAGIRRIDIRVFAGDAQEPSASLSGFAGRDLSP